MMRADAPARGNFVLSATRIDHSHATHETGGGQTIIMFESRAAPVSFSSAIDHTLMMTSRSRTDAIISRDVYELVSCIFIEFKISLQSYEKDLNR
jgi:hypothetical protein